jgi:hypothetical protein
MPVIYFIWPIAEIEVIEADHIQIKLTRPPSNSPKSRLKAPAFV